MTTAFREPIVWPLTRPPRVSTFLPDRPGIYCQCGWYTWSDRLFYASRLRVMTHAWLGHVDTLHPGTRETFKHVALALSSERGVYACTCGERFNKPSDLEGHFKIVDKETDTSMTATGSEPVGPGEALWRWAEELERRTNE